MKNLFFLLGLFSLLFFSSTIFAQVERDTITGYGSETPGSFPQEGPIDKVTVGHASGSVIQCEILDPDNWDEAKLEALEYALSLWNGVIWQVDSVRIQVQFGNLASNVLSENSINKTKVPETTNPQAVLPEPNAYYPTALAKRIDPLWKESGNDTYIDTMSNPDAIITFNNRDDWHFGNKVDDVPNDKYDFVTAMLREMARTFGFYTDIVQSGIRYRNLSHPDYTIFDKNLRNSTQTLSSIPYSAQGTALGAFATGNNVYMICQNNANYNIYSPSTFVTGQSLMYFDEAPTDTESLLMQPFQKRGDAIHRIGTKIFDLLRTLGWYYEFVAVGSNSNPQVWLTSSDINEGECLELNTPYVIETVSSYNNYNCSSGYANVSSIDIRLIKKDGTLSLPLPIIEKEFFSNNGTIIVPSLIEGNEYSRDENGMIRARVTAIGTFYGCYPYTPFESTFIVSLPSKPETPTLRIKSVEDNMEDWISDVTLGFRSFKATHYLIKKKPIPGYSITNYGANGNEYEFTLPNVFMDMDYEIKIRAYNDEGQSEETTLYIEGDPDYYLNGGYNGSAPAYSKGYRDPITQEVINLSVNMYHTSTANDLTLYFTEGKTKFAQLQLPDVEIINIGTGGTIMHLQNYNSGNAINTSHLPQGVYIVKATDDSGKIYRTKFVKK